MNFWARLVTVANVALCLTIVACGDMASSSEPDNLDRAEQQTRTATTSAPESNAAPSESKKCPCESRQFVGLTVGQYTVGLAIPGSCSLQPTLPCVNDDQCAQALSGVCAGAQRLGVGLEGADALCAVEFPGSVVCTSLELLEHVRTGSATDFPTAWYNSAEVLDGHRWTADFTSPLRPLACCK